MSTRQPFTSRADTRPTGPRRAIASFDTYAEAEAAVDSLSDRQFPVEHTQIVARDLKMVEQVTGRMRPLDAFLRGALSGAIAGALIGWLFGLFDWTDPIVASAWLAFHGLWIGALVGGTAALIAYLLLRGRRDFSSVSVLSADRYDLLVDEQFADEAARLLASTESTGSTGSTGSSTPSTGESRPTS
ncbi:MAG: hypothetical protein JWO02_1219 [Solirubrobacterales bacterium]|nr:hypothetical protein [Solirubrobacterales bacterium]